VVECLGATTRLISIACCEHLVPPLQSPEQKLNEQS
jgi:hypothetical protein